MPIFSKKQKSIPPLSVEEFEYCKRALASAVKEVMLQSAQADRDDLTFFVAQLTASDPMDCVSSTSIQAFNHELNPSEGIEQSKRNSFFRKVQAIFMANLNFGDDAAYRLAVSLYRGAEPLGEASASYAGPVIWLLSSLKQTVYESHEWRKKQTRLHQLGVIPRPNIGQACTTFIANNKQLMTRVMFIMASQQIREALAA